MRTMHLFAGVGGGLLADLILGHTPIIAVEWDAYCCQVLRERAAEGWFPELSVWEGDVRLFDPSEYQGRVDCVSGGFPCQDLSVAGSKSGITEGTRSGLYRELLRVVGVIQPKYVFMENVSAIVSNGLGTVLGDLSKMGYDARWCCLSASNVGANHKRDRWWLLAHSNGFNRGGKQQKSNHKSWKKIRNELSRVGSAFTGNGRAKWWANEPRINRVGHGIPNRMDRSKCLGNAQVPLQAAVAWRLLGGE